MNNKLIALAVAAALAAPLAAQADAKLYGKMNVGVANVDNGNDTAIAVTDEASRLGVKGSEDLGGGLSAIFKMEGTVDMDTGDAFKFNRDTYVGMKGGFGSIRLGRYNTAYKNATGKLDPFADSVGDITGSGTFGSYDQRRDNMIGYTSPNINGLSVGVELVQSELADDSATSADEAAMGTVLAVSYKGGPLFVSVANEKIGGNDPKLHEGDGATKLGLGYKTGPFGVNLVYETQTKDVAGSAEPKAMNLSGTYSLGGGNTLALSYTNVDGDATDADSTQTSVGFFHNFSKTTKVRAVYTTISNDANAKAKGRIFSGVNLAAPGNDDDPSAIQVQITHAF